MRMTHTGPNIAISCDCRLSLSSSASSCTSPFLCVCCSKSRQPDPCPNLYMDYPKSLYYSDGVPILQYLILLWSQLAEHLPVFSSHPSSSMSCLASFSSCRILMGRCRPSAVSPSCRSLGGQLLLSLAPVEIAVCCQPHSASGTAMREAHR